MLFRRYPASFSCAARLSAVLLACVASASAQSLQIYVELRFANGLWRAEPEARAAWQAIGDYNRFFAEHEQYYRGARSVASLAVVLDNRSEGVALLNGLAARNVLYHVLYEHEITPERLKPYAAVALLTADFVRNPALDALHRYVENGGRLYLARNAASRDETGARRTRPEWFGRRVGAGESFLWTELPDLDELASSLRQGDRPAVARVEAPAGVLHNVTEQPADRRRMVHLLNYLPRAVEGVTVTVDGNYKHVTLLSPDAGGVAPTVRRAGATTVIQVPRIGIYSMLVLQAEGPAASVSAR